MPRSWPAPRARRPESEAPGQDVPLAGALHPGRRHRVRPVVRRAGRHHRALPGLRAEPDDRLLPVVHRQAGGHRGEDRARTRTSRTTPARSGFFSPHSWQPLALAIGGALTFLGVIFGWWLLYFSLPAAAHRPLRLGLRVLPGRRTSGTDHADGGTQRAGARTTPHGVSGPRPFGVYPGDPVCRSSTRRASRFFIRCDHESDTSMPDSDMRTVLLALLAPLATGLAACTSGDPLASAPYDAAHQLSVQRRRRQPPGRPQQAAQGHLQGRQPNNRRDRHRRHRARRAGRTQSPTVPSGTAPAHSPQAPTTPSG